MSFHSSAQNVRVDEGHLLRASLQNGNGEWVDAELDLNQYLGNNNGRFQWDAQGFSNSANNVAVSLEGSDQVPILRAQLNNSDGNSNEADVNLGERIGNNNGQFAYN